MQEQSDLATVTQKRYQCRHVHADGRQCGSPAIRSEQFCYHHHTTRRPKPAAGKMRYLDAREPFELPVVEDLPSALSVAAQLLCRIASNDLDPERAGRLLYNLQIITSIIDKASRAAAKAAPVPGPEPLEELVNDETHGLIAPITEYIPDPPIAASTLAKTSATNDLQPATDNLQPATVPPPERDYTPEEQDYFNNTVSNRGYEPFSEFLRPASLTDQDIETHVNEQRRCLGRPPFTAIKDADGKLITIHELGARYTKPLIELVREARARKAASQQPATIPVLRANAELRLGQQTRGPRKTRRRKIRRRGRAPGVATVSRPSVTGFSAIAVSSIPRGEKCMPRSSQPGSAPQLNRPHGI